MTKRPTSFDIAQLAGVSQPTVSRALRGMKSVNVQTRQRIEAIAKSLHYAVDKNASSLRSQASNTLALLFFEEPADDDATINPFFLSMLGSITRACARAGYDLLISFQQLSGDWHVDYQDSHKADGIILLGYGDYETYRARLDHLAEQGTHVVRWGAIGTGPAGITVGSDNRGGGALATAHLIGRGRRRIAFLGTTDARYPEVSDRYHGYRDALAAAGFVAEPELQIDAVTTEAAGQAAVEELARCGIGYDAIFAASDSIAIGAMRALSMQGRTVPADVAIVGFDDLPSAQLTSPPLSSVTQDTRNAGEALVGTLLARLRGEPADTAPLPTRLVVRASSGG
ncbi:LacI family DNA-binding transcriptional regulator [Sphingomonas sp. H39-1-10]|uniref:LacI family DNA-binding transcriptional regulator n=1 Tax=Sphingomonas pollutisoli TaxID=3030829 RepID=UPI0023B886C0|nr:LacI family DNA-binding transcriptional regulator [Sphingomonas pollutisoli]MDF0488921.1 LacI family DNA-binding transcriptional regulator [Sphingomonas pollutisoli]